MLKLHDELIAELSNLLTTQNYNPVVVANHRLYARAFLDYLAECGVQVETVTLAQVDLCSSGFRSPVRAASLCALADVAPHIDQQTAPACPRQMAARARDDRTGNRVSAGDLLRI